MILQKIKVQGHKKLLLFFAGWGMDEQLFLHYDPKGFDFILVYNYSRLDFDYTVLKGYNEIKVLAWSLGVWAASQVLQGMDLPVRSAVAINGTIWPVNDKKGIPAGIYEVTMCQLSQASLLKFRRRICGSKEVLERFLAIAPKRSLEDLKAELIAVYALSTKVAPSNFQWERAFISSRDLTFPTQNQRLAWQNTPYTLMDEPHYPGRLFKALLS